MEFENKYASNSKGNLGVTLGAVGLGAALLNGGIGNILGGNGRNCGCSEDHYINRYEASQSARIAELETEVKLRDANTYTDAKLLDLYKYVDGKFGCIESQICQQNVINTQITANLSCLQNTVATLSGLTKTVIPIDSVCPEPMQRFNSWVAPTTTTTGA